MEAGTIDQKPHYPLPSFYPIYEATRRNKSVYTDSKNKMPGGIFFSTNTKHRSGRHWPYSLSITYGIFTHQNRKDIKSHPQVSIPIN